MKKGQLARSVSIVGVGYTPLGDVRKTPELLNFSERELFAWSCMEAMENGGVKAKDIDAFYVGMSGPNYDAKLKSAGPFFADWIGMRNKPAVFHDEGCASTAFGLQMAVNAVASGQYDCVISAGVNINSSVPVPMYPPHVRDDQDNDTLWASIYTGIDAAYEKPTYGGVGPVEAALVRYAIDNKLSREQVDEIFVNYLISKRKEALLNPKATLVQMTYEEEAIKFGYENVKDYLFDDRFNPRLGTYIRARFLGASVDAASAVIVCSTEKAKKLYNTPIEVSGVSTVTSLGKTFCELPLEIDKIMFKEAYEMAGIEYPNKEVDYMGIHDCPATMVLMVSESAGYIKSGESWKLMRDGSFNFDQEKPISTSGGRTQSGHPRSPAFGIEVAEAVNQMRGENGNRQMTKKPKTSVIWGGGAGYSTGICVLKSL